MLSILQDILKWKKKSVQDPARCCLTITVVSQVNTLDRDRGRTASNGGVSRGAKTTSSLTEGEKPDDTEPQDVLQ